MGDFVWGDFVQGDFVWGDFVRGDFVLEPGSTSATKSLSSSVSVILSWSESNGVKWYQ